MVVESKLHGFVITTAIAIAVLTIHIARQIAMTCERSRYPGHATVKFRYYFPSFRLLGWKWLVQISLQ